MDALNVPRCGHGCSWIDHDTNCVCHRECDRCPDRCRGPWGSPLYQSQLSLAEKRGGATPVQKVAPRVK
jgi:hypothetical protein